jgi:acetylornithine/LysW-gamma-L-lysine aminotransferase
MNEAQISSIYSGLEGMDVQAVEGQVTSGVYSKRDLVIVRGSGALLYDQNGREYIDCVGGQGIANIGHCHPRLVAAISEQVQQLTVCPELFYHPLRAAFVQRLTRLAPEGLNRAFLCNSGAEAVEGAIKFARFSTGRKGIVAAMRCFHGRTMGALSATWNKKYREPFEPLVPGYSHIPYDDLEKLKAAVTDETAAVLLEVVQGEGGVYPGSAEFLQGAQQVCRERGALLIIDEVQTGMGRTGKLFANQHYDLQPDLMCLGKAVGGGVPTGAVLIGERVGELSVGIHGSTFGGNPLSCAGGLATLDIMENEQLPQRAAELGAWMLEELRAIQSPLIREVRGLGLILGIELKQKVAPYLAALTERGVLALPAGMTVIRLLPPLVVSRDQLQQVLAALREVLAE